MYVRNLKLKCLIRTHDCFPLCTLGSEAMRCRHVSQTDGDNFPAEARQEAGRRDPVPLKKSLI